MMMAMLAVQPLSKIIPPPPPPPSVVCRLALYYYAAPRSYCSIVLHCMVSQNNIIKVVIIVGQVCCPVKIHQEETGQSAGRRTERTVRRVFFPDDG